VGARLLKTLLLSFEKKYGRGRLEALWKERPMPLSLEYLAEPNNFVSLDFLELLCDELVRGSGDPDYMTHAGRNIATPGGARLRPTSSCAASARRGWPTARRWRPRPPTTAPASSASRPAPPGR